MSRTVIYLLRHGEITQRTPRRFVGQSELPLTETGIAQMRRAGLWLAGRGISSLYVSPLERTMHSAACVAEFLRLGPDPVGELKEISLGAWENLSVAEVKEAFPGEYERRGKDMAGYRPQDGESFADVQCRAVGALNTVAETCRGQACALVAHGGVNRTILCHVLGMPLKNLFRLEQDYGCINILEKDCDSSADSSWSLRLLNFHPPIS
jgi:probable phosphoglycerate mutase